MNLLKNFFYRSTIILTILLLLPAQNSAQDVNIDRTIVYNAIVEFQEGDVYSTKMSADGSTVIFTDYATKIYTINTDGTEQKMIFNPN